MLNGISLVSHRMIRVGVVTGHVEVVFVNVILIFIFLFLFLVFVIFSHFFIPFDGTSSTCQVNHIIKLH